MPKTDSILRYPGGKSQLSKYIEYLLKLNDITGTYIEPFAGGFGVALYLLFHSDINQVVMNDYDPAIYSIWYAILNNTSAFLNKIDETDVTIEEWHRQKRIYNTFCKDPKSLENAFSTFFLNRTNISGIIKGGPIGGEEQEGKYKIDCRFNKKSLKKKIIRIASCKRNIVLSNKDAIEFITDELPKYNSSSSFIFFDPPYYKQGKNLYMSFVDDTKHSILSNQILQLSDYKWITTYDHQNEILKLYKPFAKSYEYNIRYSANQKKLAKEFLFASNKVNLQSYDKVELTRL